MIFEVFCEENCRILTVEHKYLSRKWQSWPLPLLVKAVYQPLHKGGKQGNQTWPKTGKANLILSGKLLKIWAYTHHWQWWTSLGNVITCVRSLVVPWDRVIRMNCQNKWIWTRTSKQHKFILKTCVSHLDLCFQFLFLWMLYIRVSMRCIDKYVWRRWILNFFLIEIWKPLV